MHLVYDKATDSSGSASSSSLRSLAPWVEFLPQGYPLVESRLLGGMPLAERFMQAEAGRALPVPAEVQHYAAVRVALPWSQPVCDLSTDLAQPALWAAKYPKADMAYDGVSQRIRLSGFSQEPLIHSNSLLKTFSDYADAFLPDVYGKEDLLMPLSKAVFEMARVAKTRDLMVTFEAGPAQKLAFLQPQGKGVQAVLSITPEGLLVANPAAVDLDDASALAVGCLSAAKAADLAQTAAPIRSGVLLAFNDLSKPAPVPYVATPLAEGVTVRLRMQAVPDSGPAHKGESTMLRRTMDWLRTGPC